MAWFLSTGNHIEMCVCGKHIDSVVLLGIVKVTLSFRHDSRIKWGVAGFVYMLWWSQVRLCNVTETCSGNCLTHLTIILNVNGCSVFLYLEFMHHPDSFSVSSFKNLPRKQQEWNTLMHHSSLSSSLLLFSISPNLAFLPWNLESLKTIVPQVYINQVKPQVLGLRLPMGHGSVVNTLTVYNHCVLSLT